jgi:hypothetical protein
LTQKGDFLTIVGGNIIEVNGKKDSEAPMKGFNVNVSLDDLKVKGEDVEISYTFYADYAEGVGRISIRGTLQLKEDKKTAKAIEDRWKKDHVLPDEQAVEVINALNYVGSSNGVLVSRVLNLPAPILTPRMQMKK